MKITPSLLFLIQGASGLFSTSVMLKFYSNLSSKQGFIEGAVTFGKEKEKNNIKFVLPI